MINRLTIILILAFSSSMIYADEDKYNICFINGYFAGEDDKFMGGLATQIAVDNNVLSEPVCISAHKAGFEIGLKFSTTGKYDSEQELTILRYAADFRQKVNKSIIKLIE